MHRNPTPSPDRGAKHQTVHRDPTPRSDRLKYPHDTPRFVTKRATLATHPVRSRGPETCPPTAKPPYPIVIEIKEEPDVPRWWCWQCEDGAYIGLNHWQLTFLLREANGRAKALAAENARLIAENEAKDRVIEAKDRKFAKLGGRFDRMLDIVPARLP